MACKCAILMRGVFAECFSNALIYFCFMTGMILKTTNYFNCQTDNYRSNLWSQNRTPCTGSAYNYCSTKATPSISKSQNSSAAVILLRRYFFQNDFLKTLIVAFCVHKKMYNFFAIPMPDNYAPRRSFWKPITFLRVLPHWFIEGIVFNQKYEPCIILYPPLIEMVSLSAIISGWKT